MSTLDPASAGAASVASLWWAMFTFATVVLSGLVLLWWYAIRREPGKNESTLPDSAHRQWFLGGGIALPVLSIILLLAFGIPIGHRLLPLQPSEGEVLRIDVTAAQWRWDVQYPDHGVALANELHIPVGQAIDVHLRSADVIHSFWVPRLAGKLDAIPGRSNVLRLSASEAGEFRGACAEFCGLQHSRMSFVVYAHEAADFRAWLSEQESIDD